MIWNYETALNEGSSVLKDDVRPEKHAKIVDDFFVGLTFVLFDCLFEVGKHVEEPVADSCSFDVAASHIVPDIELALSFFFVHHLFSH